MPSMQSRPSGVSSSVSGCAPKLLQALDSVCNTAPPEHLQGRGARNVCKDGAPGRLQG
jgi:hypothetical protein